MLMLSHVIKTSKNYIHFSLYGLSTSYVISGLNILIEQSRITTVKMVSNL